ncbi:hypothetical protein EJ03DRAFT_120455 [Teratosphaeria nubilosa]|uniref:Uncharacterized protein n=1 Tax=Teratosphaeria nubilosa TaxID=161662 RepID=A0A6G1L6M0_9PEZI|nr:hypothetical protein EJ03DRAFT_120455 [Teratosphaeria nubilosa]
MSKYIWHPTMAHMGSSRFLWHSTSPCTNSSARMHQCSLLSEQVYPTMLSLALLVSGRAARCCRCAGEALPENQLAPTAKRCLSPRLHPLQARVVVRRVSRRQSRRCALSCHAVVCLYPRRWGASAEDRVVGGRDQARRRIMQSTASLILRMRVIFDAFCSLPCRCGLCSDCVISNAKRPHA